jgi:hypothetical protein
MMSYATVHRTVGVAGTGRYRSVLRRENTETMRHWWSTVLAILLPWAADSVEHCTAASGGSGIAQMSRL